MLISRGLQVLALGLPAAASVSLPRLSLTRHSDVDTHTEPTLLASLDTDNSQHATSRNIPLLRTHERRAKNDRRTRHRRQEEGACVGPNGEAFECSESTCCPTQDGSNQCCGADFTCEMAADGFGTCVEQGPDDSSILPPPQEAAIIPEVIVTETIVSVTTVSETLTFIAPGLATATVTITITSFRPLEKRTAQTASPTPTPMDVQRRQDQEGVTATTTVTLTVRNTVFASTTIAPNALATVFSTTTVFTTLDSTSTTGEPSETNSVEPPASSEESSTDSGSDTETESSADSTATDEESNTATSTSSDSTTTVDVETMVTGSTDPMMTESSEPTSTSSPDSATAGLNTDQITGIILGSIFMLILILITAFLTRRYFILRRRRQAQEKHMSAMAERPATPPPQVTLTTAAGAAGGFSPGGESSSSTGENQVRIVIRPAPKKRAKSEGLWPQPPGYSGRTYSFFVEESGATTPNDPRRWSMRSEFGSTGPSPEPITRPGPSAFSSRVPSRAPSGTRSFMSGLSMNPPDNNNNNNGGSRSTAAGGQTPASVSSPTLPQLPTGIYNFGSLGIGRAA